MISALCGVLYTTQRIVVNGYDAANPFLLFSYAAAAAFVLSCTEGSKVSVVFITILWLKPGHRTKKFRNH